jgi:calcium-dependent protein kinase
VWSIGVIAYILMSGRPPFKGRSKSEIYDSIIDTPLSFDYPIWDKVSSESKDFIRKALNKDFHARPNAKALLEHDWIRKMVKEADI